MPLLIGRPLRPWAGTLRPAAWALPDRPAVHCHGWITDHERKHVWAWINYTATGKGSLPPACGPSC
jgi:hypothetical protein